MMSSENISCDLDFDSDGKRLGDLNLAGLELLHQGPLGARFGRREPECVCVVT